MGYYANSVDVNFVVPAAKTAAALAAVTGNTGTVTDPAGKLVAAVTNLTCFESEVTNDGDFAISYHHEKWLSSTETVLADLAPYAVEGSYVRLVGEDDSQFGYRVVGGELKQEYGVTQWKLEGQQ